jgi:hypothetical protein
MAGSYKSLLNKNVVISTFEEEFFDPQSGEYETINVLLNLELID